MCSTPRPRTAVKAKNQVKVVSILANLTSEQRQKFAERANSACEKRQQAQQLVLAENKRILAKRHQESLVKEDWHYWCFSASFSQLVKRLFG